MTPKEDGQGDSPLDDAISNGDLDSVSALILAGANVNFANRNNFTPLFRAIRKHKVDIIKALVASGADVNWKPPRKGSLNGRIYLDGAPALTVAATSSNSPDCVNALIAAGADINATDLNMATALSYAVGEERFAIVAALITAGADANTADVKGESPLFKAKSSKIAETLIAGGANVNAITHSPGGDFTMSDLKNVGRLLLSATVEAGNEDKVRVLIAAGADVNATDIHGATPLMTAVEYRRLEIFNLLIAAGANIKIKNKRGETAESLAKSKAEYFHKEAIEMYRFLKSQP